MALGQEPREGRSGRSGGAESPKGRSWDGGLDRAEVGLEERLVSNAEMPEQFRAHVARGPCFPHHQAPE